MHVAYFTMVPVDLSRLYACKTSMLDGNHMLCAVTLLHMLVDCQKSARHLFLQSHASAAK